MQRKPHKSNNRKVKSTPVSRTPRRLRTVIGVIGSALVILGAGLVWWRIATSDTDATKLSVNVSDRKSVV